MKWITSIAQSFADRAAELGRWAWEKLVNRTDVWGGYQPLDKRAHGSQITLPAKRLRGDRPLTEGDLRRHFRAGLHHADVAPSFVIGLHSTAPDNTSRWGAADIDWHDPDTDGSPITWAAALAWYERLKALGFTPLLVDSNGKGGYHLRVIFEEPAPTAAVYAFLQWLVSDYESYNLPKAPETFPKQAGVDSRRPFGNWLRIPGRHHTRDHWSRVWDGREWLEGSSAIDFILALEGDPVGLIPSDLVEVDTEQEPQTDRSTTYLSPPLGNGPAGDANERARRYLARLPIAIQGQNGSHWFYLAACRLVIGFGLSPMDARPLLAEYSDRCQPPWSDDEIDHALERANREPGERGTLLHADKPAWERIPELVGTENWEVKIFPNSTLMLIGPPGPAEATEAALAPVLPVLPAPTPAAPRPPSSSIDEFTPELLGTVLDQARAESAAAATTTCCQTETAASVTGQQLRCPKLCSVIQERVDGTGGRVAFYSCDRIDCFACRGAVIHKWCLTFQIRLLAEDMGDVDRLYQFHCPDEAWESVRRKIKRRGGRFFRSSVTGAVYATVAPPDVGAVEEIDRPTAIERLSDAVRQTPLNWSARHPVTHSRGWGFPVEEGRKFFYRNVGQGPKGPTANERVRQVLGGHHLSPQEQLRRSIWSKLLHGVCWSYPTSWGERLRGRLLRDLGAGELLEDWGDEGELVTELDDLELDDLEQAFRLELGQVPAGAT